MSNPQPAINNQQSSIPNSGSLTDRARLAIRQDPIGWAYSCGITLRPYQRGVILAIKDSIIHHLGLTFVVVFPRQSGKNELQAHLFSWLLFRYSHAGGRIVSVSPTFKPQTIINMTRVAHVLDKCIGSRGRWHSSKGYMYMLGDACLQFFSGDTHAKVVGATADLLLSVDEAQEVDPAKFDKDFDPMTASTNATRVFWGTAWTSSTLLERQRRIALRAQQQDGIQRVFFYTAEDVLKLVPSYQAHIDRVLAERGRNHPLIRTQYFCENLDAQSGMFTPARLALMFGRGEARLAPEVPVLQSSVANQSGSDESSPLNPQDGGKVGVELDLASLGTLDLGALGQWQPRLPGKPTPPVTKPSPAPVDSPPISACPRSLEVVEMGGDGGGSSPVAFLLDVAGMDESNTSLAASLLRDGLGNPGRDSTTLTIVSIDLSSMETLRFPTYRVLARHAWTGENHLAVFGKIKNLAEKYSPQHIVIDATGIGEGLWSLLDRQFPTRVIPVKFTAQEKSEIGWRFLSIIESGRFIDPDPSDEVRIQYSRCVSEMLPGPGQRLRWGVPDGTRGPDGELIHDDYILADSLCAHLDRLHWYVSTGMVSISEGFDPLDLPRDSDDRSTNSFYINRY